MHLNKEQEPYFIMALVFGLLSFVIGKSYLGLLLGCVLGIVSGGGILYLYFKNKK